MAQPNADWNLPQGPRHRHPRGRGHGPASSDPAPAPRTLQSHNGGQLTSTQNAQRSSDPFRHDMQSTPYWDDSNGAIHEIPSTLSRTLAPSYAQAISREPRSNQTQQQSVQLQTPTQSAFNNPYLDIVGDGPYGKNQAFYGKYGAKAAESKPTVEENMGKRRDFIPYFDAADARNGADLRSPKKHNVRNAFTTKDANKDVRKNTTNSIKTAIIRRGKLNIEKPLALVSEGEPRPPARAYDGHQPLTTPTTLESEFESPASPKIPEAGAAPSSKTASHQRPGTLSPVVEAPSPLKVSSKYQSKHKHTPTLDRILYLRAEEQAKALSQLEGGLEDSEKPDKDQRHAPRTLSWRVSDLESQPVNRTTSRDQKRPASESIAEPGSPESKKWKDICIMADQDVSAKEDDASSSVYSSDDNAQEDEIDRLSKAIAGLRPFQDLPSPSPNKTGFQRKSAVPPGLDIEKIEGGKGMSEDGAGAKQMQQAPRERTLKEAEADLLEYFNVQDTDTAKGSVGVLTSHEHSSTESFATASSEDYEQVGAEEKLEQEQNGAKRRWYKRFRKV